MDHSPSAPVISKHAASASFWIGREHEVGLVALHLDVERPTWVRRERFERGKALFLMWCSSEWPMTTHSPEPA